MAPALTSRNFSLRRWHEVYTEGETARPLYERLLGNLSELPAASRRALREQMAATLREMGMTFNPGGQQSSEVRAWSCDLLPQIFPAAEWEQIVAGFRQRLRAWELFLEDVYGERHILRSGVVPVQAVLASPNYHGVAKSLPRPRGAFLHLCGLCLARDAGGALVVKQHFFARAEGISYMVQNRRALARVVPELFAGFAVQSVAEAPVLIMEHLRGAAPAGRDEPRVVLLTPGGLGASPQLSFLARRMGIAMVQGGDLIVLEDRVFLKTVRGLEQIDVIYNCVDNEWLDPLVFRRDSRDGVPGLVHCLRKGTVALINAVGSDLADDATLLPFAAQIIRYYLRESPILPSMPTLWMGDLDQREMALEDRERWRIRRIGYHHEGGHDHQLSPEESAAFVNDVRREPGRYVAQPRSAEASTLCLGGSRPAECHQDHIIYAVRAGADFEVLPGALTRLHSAGRPGELSEWHSKDTWVLNDSASTLLPRRHQRRPGETARPTRQVMSRTADSFYWMGRYLERAYHQAYLISVIVTLETEELNSAERKHYQPIWNRLLPTLEKSAGTSRRGITNWLDRYRLVVLPEAGSVFRTIQRALANAEAMRDSISPEAWASLNELQVAFRKAPYQARIPEETAVRITRRMADKVTRLIPQFFGIASNTMLADDGWRFCETGELLERAMITANSVVSITGSLLGETRDGATRTEEIELSAFLRMLGTRDAYRRIYQARTEAGQVLELLWRHPEAPRSVRLCLTRVKHLLQLSSGNGAARDHGALGAVDELLHRITRQNWGTLVPRFRIDDDLEAETALEPAPPSGDLRKVQGEMLGSLLTLHTLISDGFFSHQSRIGSAGQPHLKGF